jgi:hypothetical protein
MVADAKAAVAWLTTHTAELDVQPDRIVLGFVDTIDSLRPAARDGLNHRPRTAATSAAVAAISSRRGRVVPSGVTFVPGSGPGHRRSVG